MPNPRRYKLTRWTLRFLEKLADRLSSKETVLASQNAEEVKRRIGMPEELFLEMDSRFQKTIGAHLPWLEAFQFRSLFMAGFCCGWKEASQNKKVKNG